MNLTEAKKIVKSHGYLIKESAESIRDAIQGEFPDLDYVVDSEGESQGSARFVDGNGHYVQVDSFGDGFDVMIWSGKKAQAEEECGSIEEVIEFIGAWISGNY